MYYSGETSDATLGTSGMEDETNEKAGKSEETTYGEATETEDNTVKINKSPESKPDEPIESSKKSNMEVSAEATKKAIEEP